MPAQDAAGRVLARQQRTAEILRAAALLTGVTADLDAAVEQQGPNAEPGRDELARLRALLPDPATLRERAARHRVERDRLISNGVEPAEAELRGATAACARALETLSAAATRLASRSEDHARRLDQLLEPAATPPDPGDTALWIGAIASGLLGLALLFRAILTTLRPRRAAETAPVADRPDVAVDPDELELLGDLLGMQGPHRNGELEQVLARSGELLRIPVHVPAGVAPARACTDLVGAARSSTLVHDEPTPSLHPRGDGGYEFRLHAREGTRPDIIVAQLRATLAAESNAIRIGTPTGLRHRVTEAGGGPR